MSSVHNEGADFWGVLINRDKSPTPLLEQLCLGIAQVMVSGKRVPRVRWR